MSEQNDRPGSALEDYLKLDVSPSGPIGGDLLARAAGEARDAKGSIPITPVGEALSPYLTPVMYAWLNTNIASCRGRALAEIEKQAKKIRIGAKLEGVVLESLHDQCDRKAEKRKFEVQREFNRRYADDLENEKRLKAEYEDKRAALGGRDAKAPNRWIDFGVLIPLILLPESLLNFESFRRAPIIQSDAMALGATILVGLGIAAAAYCLGIFVRQLNYFTRPDDQDRRRSGWPILTLGILALLISLAAVAVARYYYLLPRIEEAILLGERVPNLAMSIGSLLFGNLICFLLGAILTFFLNDENPDFSDKRYQLQKMERRLAKPRREADMVVAGVYARAKQDKEAAVRKDEQMMGKPGYSELREQVQTLTAKDAEVVGLLQSYRNALVQEIKAAGRDVTFPYRGSADEKSAPTENSALDVEEFARSEIKLFRSN